MLADWLGPPPPQLRLRLLRGRWPARRLRSPLLLRLLSRLLGRLLAHRLRAPPPELL